MRIKLCHETTEDTRGAMNAAGFDENTEPAVVERQRVGIGDVSKAIISAQGGMSQLLSGILCTQDAGIGGGNVRGPIRRRHFSSLECTDP